MNKQEKLKQLFELEQKTKGPVVCLGLTFDNDAEQRAYFSELLMWYDMSLSRTVQTE